MFRLLSFLIVLPFLLVGVAVVGLYAAYDEVDPCRALAVEQARRTEAQTGLHIDSVVEPWMRLQTGQLSTGRCVRELVHSWKERWRSDASADSGRDYGDNRDYRRGGGDRDYGANDRDGSDYRQTGDDLGHRGNDRDYQRDGDDTDYRQGSDDLNYRVNDRDYERAGDDTDDRDYDGGSGGDYDDSAGPDGE